MDIPLNAPLRIGETIIEGNTLTRPATIERELQALYAATTLQSVAEQSLKAVNRLEALGIFQNVELELLPGKHRGEADLKVSVKERRITSLRLTTFVEHNEGGVEASAKAANALGRAESLEVSALVGGAQSLNGRSKTQFRCDFTQPHWLGLPVSLVLSGDSTSQQPVGDSTYEDVSYGAAARVRTLYGVDFEWVARQRDILPARKAALGDSSAGILEYSAPPEIIASARPSLKSAIAVQFSSNRLVPDPQFPRAGSSFSLRCELASPKLTGGNVDLWGVSTRYKRVFPVSQNFSLVASLEGSAVRPLKGTTVNIQDRLFMGGPLSIRGFQPRGAGMRSSDGAASLGGTNRWQARVALEGDAPDWTHLPPAAKVHMFASAGGLSNDATVESLFKKEARVSVGLGLAFSVASARIEANAVYVVKADAKDNLAGRLQLGIGAEIL